VQSQSGAEQHQLWGIDVRITRRGQQHRWWWAVYSTEETRPSKEERGGALAQAVMDTVEPTLVGFRGVLIFAPGFDFRIGVAGPGFNVKKGAGRVPHRLGKTHEQALPR
jgi:hypothetical protein